MLQKKTCLLLCILTWLIVAPAGAQVPQSAATAVLAPAVDLAADARQSRLLHAPVMILFSETWCPWCERVRREYLLPMQSDSSYRDRVLIREVDAASGAALTDFSGAATTQKIFAARFNVRKVPVIVLLGPDGELLAEPMVGMALPDFYQAYLDEAINSGRLKLGSGGR